MKYDTYFFLEMSVFTLLLMGSQWPLESTALKSYILKHNI